MVLSLGMWLSHSAVWLSQLACGYLTHQVALSLGMRLPHSADGYLTQHAVIPPSRWLSQSAGGHLTQQVVVALTLIVPGF